MVIVIENGTLMSRNGMAGEDGPRSIYPTIMGTAKMLGYPPDDFKMEHFGEEVLSIRGVLRMHFPIINGVIKNWPVLEKIWQYTFHEDLHLSPLEHGVLVAVSILNPPANLGKIAEIMFEIFEAKNLFVAFQETLALFAAGKTTGCVVDLGHNVTRIVPVQEKKVISNAIHTLDWGGYDITIYLRKMMQNAGFSFTDGVWDVIDAVRAIKEQVGYVSSNPIEEREVFRTSGKHIPYNTIDGETLLLGPEVFLAPECLLNPALIKELDISLDSGKSGKSLAQEIVDAIQQCDPSVQPHLFGNIVLAGGTSALRGLRDRLEVEIRKLAPHGSNVQVQCVFEHMYGSWIGGSILGSMEEYQELFVTNAEFKETGLKTL